MDTIHHGAVTPDRALRTALARGLRQLCPACGRGGLYGRFLKVRGDCPSCGLELHHHRADDAPPYFVILILGHLIVPATLMLERALTPPLWLHMALWLPLTLALSLLLLPRVKGALIGFQWAHRMHGFGDTDD
ncbi:MAG: DUF983 domain-containing protein [Alphaproteobacteria bacterium]|jgi:uncharacterized protein (DUF983 family)|nr:DUF983 domain-containing protein [Alphaproteobacteria bacterium]MDP6566162.1 DUF983 domain-containing protein [Alphaproteobacteria bacterium]MDP6813597.1 DUF983 domain-containing protein [Alphaproteobacteria bacterium]